MSHEGNDHILDRIRDELEEVDPIKRVLEQCRAVEALVEAAKNAFATLDNIMLHATATWPAPGGMTIGDIEGRTKILKGLHAALEPFDEEFQEETP